MLNIICRDMMESDFDAVVKLNAAEVQQTSEMNRGRLLQLYQLSSYHKVAVVDGKVAAFLLVMSEDANYVNDNFLWFAKRMTHFLYVDRIVVSADFAGRKIGNALYADLFQTALAQGVVHIVCEYNIEPPNPVSKAFHDKWGFKEVGTQWLLEGTKRVSLQAADI